VTKLGQNTIRHLECTCQIQHNWGTRRRMRLHCT